MEPSIYNSVRDALPTLSSELLNNVVDHLTVTCGVSKFAELRLVQERDLSSVLRIIEARILIEHWKTYGSLPMTEVSPAEVSVSTSVPSTSAASKENVNWPATYAPPYSKMPASVRSCVKHRKRPTPKARRMLVCVIVDDIRVNVGISNPNRSQLARVAEKLTTDYPDSFQDRTDEGDVIGLGYLSLLNQLKNRLENVNRSAENDGFVRRRVASTPDNPGSPKCRKMSDSYGCVNWQPELPEGSTVEVLELKKEEMREAFKLGPERWDRPKIADLMTETYFLQRRAINAQPAASISDLTREWPFLCQEAFLISHFKTLLNIDSRQKFCTSKKTEKILKFMEESDIPNKVVKSAVSAIVHDRLHVAADRQASLDMAAVHLLLLEHFKEDRNVIFVSAEATDTVADILERDLPNTPCLIALGGTLLTSQRFMLAVEQSIVCEDIGSLNSGLAMLFSAFYVFNLQYPESVGCTLEFIQRYIVCINPDNGTKVARGAKKKKDSANPRILSLTKSLSDFEWMN